MPHMWWKNWRKRWIARRARPEPFPRAGAGLAYKKNVPDIRESPSLRLMELLLERGADVSYHDPFIAEIPKNREYSHLKGRRSVAWDQETLSSFDVVLIATDHDTVDYQTLADWCPLIVDTRNTFAPARLLAKP